MGESRVTIGVAPGRLPARPGRAIAHLQAADPVMARAIGAVGKFGLRERPADLHLLCSSVIGQSISTAAAASIVGRFSEQVGRPGRLRPGDVLAHPAEELRALGLTRAKAECLRAVAELWQRERLGEARLRRLSDEEITELLVTVKGIGPWTAKMFLIFGLRRPDVLPQEDLGLREALRVLHGLEVRPAPAEARSLCAAWRPWATVGTVYAWRYLARANGDGAAGESGWW